MEIMLNWYMIAPTAFLILILHSCKLMTAVLWCINRWFSYVFWFLDFFILVECSINIREYVIIVHFHLFLPHDAMLARYMLWSYVRPSVCPSEAGTVLKRLNIGSRKQHRTIAQGLGSEKFERDHPQRGRQVEVG